MGSNSICIFSIYFFFGFGDSTRKRPMILTRKNSWWFLKPILRNFSEILQNLALSLKREVKMKGSAAREISNSTRIEKLLGDEWYGSCWKLTNNFAKNRCRVLFQRCFGDPLWPEFVTWVCQGIWLPSNNLIFEKNFRGFFFNFHFEADSQICKFFLAAPKEQRATRFMWQDEHLKKV